MNDGGAGGQVGCGSGAGVGYIGRDTAPEVELLRKKVGLQDSLYSHWLVHSLSLSSY